MEKLKSTIPERVRALISSTPSSDLSASTAALAEHFSTSPQFSQLLEQLTNPHITNCSKDAEDAANWKRDGNAAFGSKNYDRALSCYTKALLFAPNVLNVEEEEAGLGFRAPLAVLYVNRAATLHKIQLLEAAMRDCDRAISLNPSYSKAWYRRGRVKCDMRDYAGAARDTEKALATETTSEGRLQIKKELALVESKIWPAVGPEQQEQKQKKTVWPSFGGLKKILPYEVLKGLDGLRKRWTEEKGWSLETNKELSKGSLVLEEDPYAAIVLKSARDTHCHFCFQILPPDPVPCGGCAIPLYCSELCRNSALGHLDYYDSQNSELCSKEELRQNYEWAHSVQRLGQHIPECGGASWSAVLQTDAVLGARMLFHRVCMDNGLNVKKIYFPKGAEGSDVDTLCHHYDQMDSNEKLELQVLGSVTAHCLHQSVFYGMETGTTAAVASKLIKLIAQTRVNAVAIFGMSSPDIDEDFRTPLCTVEQVKVAQGVYLVGSRLNHSCAPNVHASFLLGRLFVRAVSDIPEGSTLDISYGPQLGEFSRRERKQILSKKYFFSCECPCCAKLTVRDLLLRGFQCNKPGCMGVVLGPDSESMLGPGEGNIELSLENYDKTRAAVADFSPVGKWLSKAGLIEHIGRCMGCGMDVDVKFADEVARKGLADLERVEADLARGKDVRGERNGVLKSLTCLRSTLHTYNQHLAKGEDIAARISCALGEPLKALKHCQRSIEILKHLFNEHHIVVGNEYLKLASIAIAASEMPCARECLTLVDQIFSVYYGPDYKRMIPYVVKLQKAVQ